MSVQIKPDFDTLPDSAFVRQAQLLPTILPVSPATFWRMVLKNEFPKPIKLGTNISAWKVGAVREWIRQREAA